MVTRVERAARSSHSANRPRGRSRFELCDFPESFTALDCERFERSRFRNFEIFSDRKRVVTALEEIVRRGAVLHLQALTTHITMTVTVDPTMPPAIADRIAIRMVLTCASQSEPNRQPQRPR